MSGRGNKRFGSRAGRGGHRQAVKTTFNSKFNIRRERDRREKDGEEDTPMQNTAAHKILITGYSHNTNTEVLRTHLIGKADITFLEDTKIIAVVGTKAEALSLQNISGTLFANRKLNINYLDRSSQPNRGGRIVTNDRGPTNVRLERKAIEQFVTRYYDPDERMLNLTNLKEHLPNLNSVDFNNRSFALQLFDIMSNSCPDILTIVLNRNNISKLGPFASMSKYRLKIMNISLDSNNELSHLKDLNLRELVLSNNPVCAGLDEVGYKLEVVRRLPDLGFLDTRKIKQGVDNHPVTQLPPIQGNFFDAPNRQALADGFLQKYYEAYDNDRDLLVHAYAEQSCFSLSLLTVSKAVGRGGSSFSRGDKMVPYTPHDRNLTVNKSLDTRASTLKTGPTHIVGTLLDFPATKHDYESFTVDCFVSSVGAFEMLNVFVHGSFLESTKVKRSFSRVFLLAQPPPGSKPDGWPLMIINDLFYVRYFTPKRVKAPPPQVPPTTTTTTTTLDQATLQNMVKKLAEITTMNLEFSEQCLAKNSWSYEQALVNFQELRANNQIPPAAYVK